MSDQFKSTSLYWKWFLWIVLVIPLTIYIVISTNHIWPSLLSLSILGAITIVGCSFYVAIHITDLRSTVRSMAVIWAVVIEGALLANTFIHGGASRDFESAKIGEIERKEKLKETVEVTERLNKSEAEKLLAQGEADKGAAKKADAERRKFLSTGIINSQPKNKTVEQSPTLESPKIKTVETEVGTTYESPAQVLSKSFWPIFVGFILEILASAGGGLAVLARRLHVSESNQSASFPSPKSQGNLEIKTAQKPPGKTAQKPPKENRLEGTSRRYPDAGSLKGTDPGTFIKSPTGGFWKVLGRQFPDIPGIRYTGKIRKTVVEVWDGEGNWITQFGKRELLKLDQISDLEQNLSRKRDFIESALVKKSEQRFANQT